MDPIIFALLFITVTIVIPTICGILVVFYILEAAVSLGVRHYSRGVDQNHTVGAIRSPARSFKWPYGRASRFLVVVLEICASIALVYAVITLSELVAEFLFFAVPAFFSVILVILALKPLARKRGWGIEGRLTRYLTPPPLIDESKRLHISGAASKIGFEKPA